MTTYYDTRFSGLVPVQLVERLDSVIPTVKVKVSRDHRGYKKGEIIEINASSFVKITRRTKYNTFVATA